MTVRVLFVDRDGTLIEEPTDNQVDSLDKVRLMPGVIPALLDLSAAGYRFVMVSNQDGIGSESFPEPQFRACHEHVLSLFGTQGIEFDQVFICPHRASDGCDCRKPRTGLVTRYLAGTAIDTARSAVIGDRDTDMQFADRIGLRGIRIRRGGDYDASWRGIAEQLLAGDRVASVERKTRETDIRALIRLDAGTRSDIATGIGFLDHMLEQLARHGGFALELHCRGDLDVDEHHTVEDVAIVLGTALRQALGDKRGIGRYGFLLPMDESEARVSLDLSGRGVLEFDAPFPRDSVGELSTEMVEHFFRSFAESLGAALHIEVRGRNTHHMVEACFKGVARSLRQAIAIESADLPTTKGVLA